MTERNGFHLDELHAEERGLLLGLSLLAASDVVLSRLSGDRRQACRGAWQNLRALPRPDRAAVLAGWIVEISVPFPPGMERLHPSWLADAMAGEPPELWPALLAGLPGAQAVESLLSQFRWEPSEGSLCPSAPHPSPLASLGLERWSATRGAGEAGGLPTRQSHGVGAMAKEGEVLPPESVAELQRCVFGRLAPLCVGPSGPVGAGLCRLGCEELLAEVARRGAGLPQELRAEGDASLRAVAGRLPATLGRHWVKW